MCRTTPSAAGGCVWSACCPLSSVHCGRPPPRLAVPSASEGAATSYCPYDLSSDPAEFGLTADHVGTRFGPMLVLHRPERGGDEATLLLHGVGATWTTWAPRLRAAGSALTEVVAVDLPGFGESENRLGHLQSLTVAAELGGVLAGLGY